MNLIKRHLIPELERECKAVKALDANVTVNTISELCDPITELIEMKSVVIEALFSEYHEALTILV
jgi:pantothenate kinase